MNHHETIEGTLSSKFQVTIPAQVREALGMRPGNKLEFKLEKDGVMLHIKRPDPLKVLDAILEQYDVSVLQAETKNNATKTLREDRWGDDL